MMTGVQPPQGNPQSFVMISNGLNYSSSLSSRTPELRKEMASPWKVAEMALPALNYPQPEQKRTVGGEDSARAPEGTPEGPLLILGPQLYCSKRP